MEREATLRHYLMVRPTYYDVEYSINPWMDPAKPTSAETAIAQWERLRDLFIGLGHTVEVLEARAGLPDMVFAANGATIVEGRVLVARFKHEQRRGESDAYLEWFGERGYQFVRKARYINEGEGDLLVVGDRILAGAGFRTEPAAHREAEEFLGRPVIGLTLADPRFYHLDTALAVLDADTVMYNPRAFAPESRRLLEHLYPDSIQSSTEDAVVFGLNAVSDGRHVVLPEAATGLMEQLRERDFKPISADTSELLKAGGSAKCCTLEIRG